MKTHPLPVAALAAVLTLCTAHASALPFNASYTGTAEVVEVLNASGPVLRFETVASGSGSFDLTRYFSTDVIDMATGVGSGSNRFVAVNGDELFGSFSVQVVPTAVANIVDLLGQTQFTGGTGQFAGATGSASFSGSGVFISATAAVASLTYTGSVAVVPEPTMALLLPLGLAALGLGHRVRRAGQNPSSS